jgi:acyl dehydratase
MSFVGRNLGTSDWIEISQSLIDQFAKCTGDHQWIHVDVVRARKESRSGGTIAHRFLSLALVAPLAMEIGLTPKDASAVLNYGLDKVRFITPVKPGDRVRLQLFITDAKQKDNGRHLVTSKAPFLKSRILALHLLLLKH